MSKTLERSRSLLSKRGSPYPSKEEETETGLYDLKEGEKAEEAFEESNRVLCSALDSVEKAILAAADSMLCREASKVHVWLRPRVSGSRRLVISLDGVTPKHNDVKVAHLIETVRSECIRIRERIKTGRFASFGCFAEELETFLDGALVRHPELGSAEFLSRYTAILESKSSEYRTRKLQDLNELTLCFSDVRVGAGQFPLLPLQPRQFRTITEYKAVPRSEDPKKLLASGLKGSCGPGCICSTGSIKDFARYSPEIAAFASDCCDKQRNIECGESCGCGADCKNRQISKARQLELGKDIAVKLCWGIDLFTRKNLFLLIPLFLSIEARAEMVDLVVKCLNESGLEGWNISNAITRAAAELRRLAAESSEAAESNTKNRRPNFSNFSNISNPSNFSNEISTIRRGTPDLATRLEALSILATHARTAQVRGLLRVHPKGLGVICTAPQGIPRNSLIVRYLGEVYSPWYWYVKQEGIKSFLTRAAKDRSGRFREYRANYNMDFYNILLEKQPSEPGGKQILVVDPILNGNFASRLSHSCAPNCCTLPTIASGQYNIGLFSTKDIAFGEELTFNYFSSTDSEKEHLGSICLCGSLLCLGHYLRYNRKFQAGLPDQAKKLLLDHPGRLFVGANAALLAAVLSPFTSSRREKLAKFAFGDNAFGDSPDWLKNWVFFALEDAESEKERLAGVIRAPPKRRESAGEANLADLDQLFSFRVASLFVALDKARNFLAHQPPALRATPPLRLAPSSTQLARLEGILASLGVRAEPTDFPTELSDLRGPARQIAGKRWAILKAAEPLRAIRPAEADLLFLESLTVLGIQAQEFEPFEVEIPIRECDLINPQKSARPPRGRPEDRVRQLEQVITVAPKRLTSQLLWAQLAFWSRAIERPEAALSAAKKGTLSPPQLAPLLKARDPAEYPYRDRQRWIQAMRTRPAEPWPAPPGWNFEQPDQLLGSFLLDAAFFGQPSQKTIDALDESFEKRKKAFVNIWKKSGIESYFI